MLTTSMCYKTHPKYVTTNVCGNDCGELSRFLLNYLGIQSVYHVTWYSKLHKMLISAIGK
jgi:hypothetical protein